MADHDRSVQGLIDALGARLRTMEELGRPPPETRAVRAKLGQLLQLEGARQAARLAKDAAAAALGFEEAQSLAWVQLQRDMDAKAAAAHAAAEQARGTLAAHHQSALAALQEQAVAGNDGYQNGYGALYETAMAIRAADLADRQRAEMDELEREVAGQRAQLRQEQEAAIEVFLQRYNDLRGSM
jgi:hypothetical protein